MLRATKVRLLPTAEEVEFLNRQFGAVRFVRNKALAIKVHRYRAHGQKLSAKHDLKKLLAVAKKSRRYAWLAGYDSMALQQACIDLDKAFGNVFEGRARFPRFKRKQGEQSSYHCSGKIGFGEDWIQRPKIATRIRAVIHRPITGELKSITVSRTVTGKYFASILVEDGLAKPEPVAVVPEEAIVGADAGQRSNEKSLMVRPPGSLVYQREPMNFMRPTAKPLACSL
jgi:putative transposase